MNYLLNFCLWLNGWILNTPAQDYGTLLCWGNNDIGTQSDPCIFSINPAGNFHCFIYRFRFFFRTIFFVEYRIYIISPFYICFHYVMCVCNFINLNMNFIYFNGHYGSFMCLFYCYILTLFVYYHVSQQKKIDTYIKKKIYSQCVV